MDPEDILLDILPVPEAHSSTDTETSQKAKGKAREVVGTDFLEFIHLLNTLVVSVYNPCILNVGKAVAASGTVGRGGQYVVDRIFDNQIWPEKPEVRVATNVVYKRLSGSRMSNSSTHSQDKHTLAAFSREIRVLSHLQNQHNIINLCGVAWEEVSAKGVLPVLVLEYSPLGSLGDFLGPDQGHKLLFSQKRALTCDIAMGMAVLHRNGFIWGDAKPDNVLLFPDEKMPGGFRAKISDFGLCVHQPGPNTCLHGFTEEWAAPEVIQNTTLPICGSESLVKAEIYAFGLISWAIALNDNPFCAGVVVRDGTGSSSAISHHVSKAELLAIRNDSKRPDALHRLASSSLEFCLSRNHEIGPIASQSDIEGMKLLLRHSLHYDPRKRLADMEVFVDQLSPGSQVPTVNHKPCPQFTGELSYPKLFRDYGEQSDLWPVASAIFQKLCEYNSDTNSPQGIFQSSIFHLIGFGTPRNVGKATAAMNYAAKLGYLKAIGLAQRLRTIQRTEYGTDDITMADIENLIGLDEYSEVESEWLVDAALDGSWLAAEDLFRRNKQEFERHLQSYAQTVGHPLCFWNSDAVSSIHEVAMNGNVSALLLLLDQEAVHLDSRNEDGETPLICAIRGSQVDIAEVLLKRGANPEISDSRGATALHWFITLDQAKLNGLKAWFRDIWPDPQTNTPIAYSEQWFATMEPGTPLDWAVDVRNHAMIEFLININADPFIETLGRISSFNRAAGRHDWMVTSELYSCGSGAAFDSRGNTALAYCIGSEFRLERLLLNDGGRDSLAVQLDTFNSNNPNDLDWNYINTLGESALYYATREGNVSLIRALLQWMGTVRPKSLAEDIIQRTGPNGWTALRRAIYLQDLTVFDLLRTRLPCHLNESIRSDSSPDGLTLMHEIAFSSIQGKRIIRLAEMILNFEEEEKMHELDKEHRYKADALQNRRLRQRVNRPSFTPFQLAVLCQKFELADFLTRRGSNPLVGLQKSRFLGFLIDYQKYSSYELSSWLSHVHHDPTPNVLRRFPHPTTIHKCISYLLQNDSCWWTRFAISEGPGSYDRDPDHEPMLSWRPSPNSAMIVGFFKEDDKDEDSDENKHLAKAIDLYGVSGIHEAVFYRRWFHTKAFRSFLVRYRQDSQKHAMYGHRYITALELAFDAAMSSPQSLFAEDIFEAVIGRYTGAEYTNFPYRHLSRFGKRYELRNLARRETLLHRAIRSQRPRLVRLLLEHGADWKMANVNWQSPLHLATLASQRLDPESAINYGSFLHRLNQPLPPRSSLIDAMNRGSDPATEILRVVERHAIKMKAKESGIRRLFGLWGLSRALSEVRWPWSEYEADDLGLRFVLIYAAWATIFIGLVSIIVLAIGSRLGILTYILAFYEAINELADKVQNDPGTVSEIVSAMIPGYATLVAAGSLLNCYTDAVKNGSDPKLLCTDYKLALKLELFPLYRDVEHLTIGFYNSMETWIERQRAKGTASNQSSVCPEWFWDNPTFLNSYDEYHERFKQYVYSRCTCECSGSGEPNKTVSKVLDESFRSEEIGNILKNAEDSDG